jgi:hypothetical protein
MNLAIFPGWRAIIMELISSGEHNRSVPPESLDKIDNPLTLC